MEKLLSFQDMVSLEKDKTENLINKFEEFKHSENRIDKINNEIQNLEKKNRKYL